MLWCHWPNMVLTTFIIWFLDRYETHTLWSMVHVVYGCAFPVQPGAAAAWSFVWVALRTTLSTVARTPLVETHTRNGNDGYVWGVSLASCTSSLQILYFQWDFSSNSPATDLQLVWAAAAPAAAASTKYSYPAKYFVRLHSDSSLHRHSPWGCPICPSSRNRSCSNSLPCPENRWHF